MYAHVVTKHHLRAMEGTGDKEMSLTSVCPNEAHSRTWRKKESNQVLLGYDIRVRIGAYLRSKSVISLGLGNASKKKVLIEHYGLLSSRRRLGRGSPKERLNDSRYGGGNSMSYWSVSWVSLHTTA